MMATLFRSSRASGPVSRAGDRWVLRLCLWLPLLGLLMFFGLPMLNIVWRSFIDDNTSRIGLSNYHALVDSPAVWQALLNSLLLGGCVTLLTLLLGFAVAYALERSAIPGKRLIEGTMALPVIAPSLVLGLGLIFLLGRNGLVGKMLGIRPEIYGFWGLLLADVLYALPHAILIIRAALRHGDARQYEAAEVLGAGGWRQFLDLTLPSARYGLLSAALVVFTITLTDFGNAVVIGGDFSVLATEIYKQVSGQMKFGLGSVIGLVLLLPATLSVWIERVAARRQGAAGSEVRLEPPAWCGARDLPLLLLSALVALAITLTLAVVVYASFIELWPYRMSFTLRNYAIDMAGGYAPLWSSIWISLLTAMLGVSLLFLLTFGVRRLPGRAAGLAVLLASMPVAVPGLVLGLAYVFTFNTATLPWGVLYGTPALIVLCNFYHYHTQGYAAMMAGMRTVPQALADATTALGGGVWHTLRDVYVPAMRSTLVSVALFLFMNAMVTLSAVIFLVTPSVPLAAVTVMRLDEAGLTSQAAAFSTCIMAVVGCMALLLKFFTRERTRPNGGR